MAKKKDDTVAPNEVPAPVSSVAAPADPVIDEVDFNELLELEKAVKQTADQFNTIAGNIKRLEKDLDLYHNHEKTINGQIDLKRKDLIKRYKIDDQRQWRIDVNSRKVVYVG